MSTSCCICVAALDESIEIDGTQLGKLKSCLECSKNAGKHVFYEYSSFGIKATQDGKKIALSLCSSCITSSTPALAPIMIC